MKRHITIAMLLVAGAAFANAEDTVLSSELSWSEVLFNNSATLTSGNQAMSWSSGAAYTDWVMYFTITAATDSGYKGVITTGVNNNGSSSGLAVGVSSSAITFANGATQISGASTLSFNVNDSLAFVYSDNVAYLGNLTTGSYITLDSLPSGITTTMTSGSSRAWTNGGTTQLSNVKIANLAGTIYVGNSGKIATLIPEPSAFGLLAGLGALALAGTRRRRRK